MREDDMWSVLQGSVSQDTKIIVHHKPPIIQCNYPGRSKDGLKRDMCALLFVCHATEILTPQEIGFSLGISYLEKNKGLKGRLVSLE